MIDGFPSVPLQGGNPYPMGSSCVAGGVNMALPSYSAKAMWVDVFSDDGHTLCHRYELVQQQQGIFYGLIPDARVGMVYGIRAIGFDHQPPHWRQEFRYLLLDPWAKALVGQLQWSPSQLRLSHDHHESHDDTAPFLPKAKVVAPIHALPLDHRPWQADAKSTFIGEVHIKGYTQNHPQLPESLRGTYLGLCHPTIIQHFRELSITTLCIQPVAYFVDEPFLVKKGLTNYWGYNPLAMMVPTPRYANNPHLAAEEFKAMVDTLHQEGFEVVLDVVLNHSAEGDERGATLSFKGLDAHSWYHFDEQGAMINDSGCGNTMNLNHPIALRWAMDVLRHWALAYGVDGFRFDLATVMGRSEGRFRAHSPLFMAIQQDPVLSRLRCIAEPWDLGIGGYQLGHFPPPFAEWNDRFRDATRRFWMGLPVSRGEWAERFIGSPDRFRQQYPERFPALRNAFTSINYVAAHDGLTLQDMVSFSEKHNHANGEENRDGRNFEPAVNLGHEGLCHALHLARQHLKRNLLANLILARGTPMLRLGDEWGQSQGGNNNAFCQDNDTSWLTWATDSSLVPFIQHWMTIRQHINAWINDDWLDAPQAQWLNRHALPLSAQQWEQDTDPTLALWVQADAVRSPEDSWWLGMNPSEVATHYHLPEGRWQVIGDTSCTFKASTQITEAIHLPPQSLMVLRHSLLQPI